MIEELKKIVGDERVLIEEAVIRETTNDYIGYRRFERMYGLQKTPLASCVVRVKDVEQTSEVLKFLNENKINTIPRTGGSSVTKSIEPVEGGVILDGSDMNQILEVNEKDMIVTCQCGTPLEKLENYLEERGYTTGHFPQSLPMADLGGLVATRSIGQWSTLYGGIEDLLVGIEAVMADGEIIRIKNNPRRSVGPDLRHIFLGSEGMLGFITEVSVKIFKYRPEERWMCAYAIKGMHQGLDFLRDIMVSGYKAAVVRLHDPLEVVLQHGGVAPEGYAMVLLLAEGPAPITKATGEAINEMIKKYDHIVLGEKPVQSWIVHRNDVCNTIDNDPYCQQGLVADTCEISACWSKIGKIYDAVTKRVAQEMSNLYGIGGHSSHSYMQGTNIYFQFAFKSRGVETVEEDYMRIIRIIMEETLKEDGSIAHHHGSGKYRTQWMPREHGTSYSLMYKLKEAMDPNYILNKGVLLVDKK
ncbi:FAD-binding oxidoreductase [Clostridium sp. CS001]|uniref:FAD-binding oxidoreductase n=1 Tax=Clostridium sp. CS001 TaxID=2880648 RepID=UPI001CF14A7C|nr:FAD-binding oxidoreductase [Clostridium sp. CS001]MCB2289849.1 FAD-binding oxidoreductase [Clostridium sp. CS001]